MTPARVRKRIAQRLLREAIQYPDGRPCCSSNINSLSPELGSRSNHARIAARAWIAEPTWQ